MVLVFPSVYGEKVHSYTHSETHPCTRRCPARTKNFVSLAPKKSPHVQVELVNRYLKLSLFATPSSHRAPEDMKWESCVDVHIICLARILYRGNLVMYT
jgi:hypothetical protein